MRKETMICSMDEHLVNEFAYFNYEMMRLPDTMLIKKEDIVAGLIADKIVLNLGCAGDGKESLITALTQTFAKNHIGVDRKRVPSADFLLDLEEDSWDSVSFLRDTYDIVLLCDVLEHLRNPGLLLDNLYQHFSCDIFISFPNPMEPTRFLLQCQGIEAGNGHHCCGWTMKQFMNLAGDTGFNIKDCGYCFTDTVAPRSEIPWIQPGIYFLLSK